MNANEIVLKFTLDIKGIKSAINQVEKDLKQFGSESVGATQGLNNALEQTEKQLTNISAKGRNFTNNATQSLDKFRVSAGAAGGSAIAFNRIIQDAPFGIIGVGNNIQQFAEQLTALRATTGTTGAALKTFFTSLISPANLVILAVSAITSAFTAYQLSAQKSKDSTKELSDELGDYIKTLNGVDKATLDSTISIDQEIFKFDSLVSVLNDANSSYRQRKNAVDQIQSGYGQYLGNITNEEILVKGLGKAYDNVISALIAKSALEANATEINKNLKETAELNKKRNDEEARYIELQKLLQSKRSQLARTQELINSGEIKGSKTKNQLKDDIATIIETQNQYNVSIDAGKVAIENNEAALKNLIEGYTNNLKALLSYDKGQKDAADSGDKLNRVFDEQILLVERFGDLTDVNKKKVDGLFKSLAEEQKALFEQIASLKQEPITFVNAAQIAIAQEKLSEIDKIIGSIASKREDTEIVINESLLEGLELPDENVKNPLGDMEMSIADIEKTIAALEKLKSVTTDSTQLAKYSAEIDVLKTKLEGFSDLKDKTQETTDAIVDAFSSLGAGIAASLNIGDRALRGFVTTLLSSTPKIIGAILAKSRATRSAQDQENASNLQLATGNAVVSGTEAAKGLGPIGLALLPVFIAGAVALVSSAFGKSSGGSVSAGTGSTFTNREFGGPVSKGRAYIVGERRPELFVPNTNGIIVPQLPSMDYSGASMQAGAMAVDVNIRGVSYGDDILFTVQQAQIRRGLR